MPCEPIQTTEDERLIVLAKAIAPDIADNVVGAGVCEYGFSTIDAGELQIKVQPYDQIDETEDRDGGIRRDYVLWIVGRQLITHTDTTGLTEASNLMLRIAKRYPENIALGQLNPVIEGFENTVIDDKQFIPFYDQRELDEKDYWHSILVIRFREHF